MVHMNVQPNISTFNFILDACGRTQQIDQVLNPTPALTPCTRYYTIYYYTILYEHFGASFGSR